MFRKLLQKAANAHFEALAAKGGLACPNCGAKPISITNEPDQLILCSFCSTKALPGDWAAAARNGGLVGISDQPPAGTKITRKSDRPGVIEWNIPATGRSSGLFFAAIFWCAITAVVSGVFLLPFISRGSASSTHHLPAWVLIPFFGVFWVIGLGMFYLAIRKKYARHVLILNRQSVTLRRELFGRTRENCIARENIRFVAQVVFYQLNDEPVFGIEISGQKKKLRFGSDLRVDEKSWLVGSLRRQIFGSVTATVKPVRVPASGCFSISATHLLKHNLPFAIASSLMGALFLWVVSRFWMFQSLTSTDKLPFFQIIECGFSLLDNLFHCLFYLISGSMFVSGIATIIWVCRNHDQQTRFEGNESTVTIQRLRGDRILSERSFARESISDILSSVSSSTGGITSKRIQFIIADRAETVATSIIADKADAVVAEIRQALGIR